MIYYVEDDTNIRDLTVYALKQAGFDTKCNIHIYFPLYLIIIT